MRIFFSFLLALFSIHSNVSAKEIELCGITFFVPAKKVEFHERKISADLCNIEMNPLLPAAPPVLQDNNLFEIAVAPLQMKIQQFSYFEFFPKKGYRLSNFEAVVEPQYSLAATAQQNSTFRKEGRLYVYGKEAVRVQANPSQLWPDEQNRKIARSLYIGNNGLMMDCFYGHVSNERQTTTLSICLPRGKTNRFLNVNDIEKLFKSINYIAR